eukprot:368217-Rhodomonas_salina.2
MDSRVEIEEFEEEEWCRVGVEKMPKEVSQHVLQHFDLLHKPQHLFLQSLRSEVAREKMLLKIAGGERGERRRGRGAQK